MGQIKIKDHLSPAEAEVGAELGNKHSVDSDLLEKVECNKFECTITDGSFPLQTDNKTDSAQLEL